MFRTNCKILIEHCTCAPYEATNRLVLCYRLILGSAVSALATVKTPKTVASAKTANFDNPYFLLQHCTSFGNSDTTREPFPESQAEQHETA